MTLTVEHVVKSFGGLTAINELSFEVDDAQIFGVIGPNGAGKTTLFNLIMGTLRLDAGAIYHDGERIDGYNTHERVNRGICRTYQIPRPFPELTVLENIRSCTLPNSLNTMRTRGSNRERAAEICEMIDLEKRADASPDELTPGELRRLEIGKALATDPSVLLLDEIFAGITHEEASVLADLILALRDERGYTILVIDHVMDMLMPLVDEVIVINFGEKVMQGTPEEVVNDPEVRSVYLGEEETGIDAGTGGR